MHFLGLWHRISHILTKDKEIKLTSYATVFSNKYSTWTDRSKFHLQMAVHLFTFVNCFCSLTWSYPVTNDHHTPTWQVDNVSNFIRYFFRFDVRRVFHGKPTGAYSENENTRKFIRLSVFQFNKLTFFGSGYFAANFNYLLYGIPL